MPNTETPPGDSPAASAVDELVRAWDGFRKGGMVSCPNDGASVALGVDASAALYRFVCTQCGAATPWFESAENGIRLLGVRQPNGG